jgi:hypothetical protein
MLAMKIKSFKKSIHPSDTVSLSMSGGIIFLFFLMKILINTAIIIKIMLNRCDIENQPIIDGLFLNNSTTLRLNENSTKYQINN